MLPDDPGGGEQEGGYTGTDWCFTGLLLYSFVVTAILILERAL